MMKLRCLFPAILIAFALAGCAAQINQTAAQNAYAAGRLDEAAADIQTALAHDPDNLTLKQLAAEIFTQRGLKYYQGGAMIAAQADFQRAVAYQPNYAMAWDYLGLLASQQNDWQHAIDYGTRAAGLEGKPNPSYVDFARQQLRRIQSGGVRPYLPPERRPNVGSNSGD